LLLHEVNSSFGKLEVSAESRGSAGFVRNILLPRQKFAFRRPVTVCVFHGIAMLLDVSDNTVVVRKREPKRVCCGRLHSDRDDDHKLPTK